MGVGHQHPGQTLLGLYVGTLKRVNNRIIRNCSDDVPRSFTSYRWCAGEPPLLSLLLSGLLIFPKKEKTLISKLIIGYFSLIFLIVDPFGSL